jgi:hypothetical protein
MVSPDAEGLERLIPRAHSRMGREEVLPVVEYIYF